MKLIDKPRRIPFTVLLFSALFLAMSAMASQGDFYPTYQARIAGHVELRGKAAQQMILQHDGKKTYLYVRQPAEQGYTVVDVTKPKRPKIVNHLPQQNLSIVDSGLGFAETPESTATSSSSAVNDSRVNDPRQRQQAQSTPQTVQVIDVVDPAHPRRVKTFNGVTSIVNDSARHLTYIANADGIWILAHKRVLRRHFCSSSDAISSAEPNCL
ncbi:MAG: hypothetical protein WAK56_22950 [Candidatus Sulfotelmatobacter sp.]